MIEKHLKIIVSIEDIDWLSEEEIIAVFYLVKALADFPNSMYKSHEENPTCNHNLWLRLLELIFRRVVYTADCDVWNNQYISLLRPL